MLSKIRKNYEFYKKQYFRGDDIYCPFCSGFYKAQKFSITKESSTVCPVCSSTADERTVLLFLLANTNLLSGELKVLIIAEDGVMIRFFENFPNAEVKKHSSRDDFMIRNEKGMKYRKNHFDIIICNYILEKHPSPNILMSDIKNTLKPDGIVLLQANIDQNREKTADYPHMYHKDRLRLYGIPGNLRRYGKDYGDIIGSYGLNMSRLKFSSGFESLPEYSFDKNEILYLAHLSERPLLVDNMDELESEMEEQRFISGSDRFSALIYTVFFILPSLIKRNVLLIISNISEREENKGTLLYMLYVILTGQISFWAGIILFKIAPYIKFPGSTLLFILIILPLYAILTIFGLFIMGGYFMTNSHAGILKRITAGIIFSVTVVIGIVGAMA